MKKYIFALLASILGVASLSVSCSSGDELDANSSIVDVATPSNEFDKWLDVNLLKKYNIQLAYRYKDTIVDMEPALIPADYNESILLSKLIIHLVLEVYDELMGSNDFMVAYFPKLIQLIGSPSYNNDGSVVLGEAEGGKTIYLYDVNTLSSVYNLNSIDALNDSYFHTMHHEFAHILHQTKLYSSEYETISSSLYVGSDCFTTYDDDEKTTVPWLSGEEKALKVGFITPYSATNADEDFVEILSTYVTNSQDYWDSLMTTAGDVGEPIITQKLDIIRNYLLTSWGIDMDELRSIILRRQTEVWNLDYSLD